MLKVICNNCKKEFYKFPSRIGKEKNFCSLDCKNAGWGRVITICKQCDRTFSQFQSLISSRCPTCRANSFFCKVPDSYYSPKGKIRIQLICQECGRRYKVLPSRQWTNKKYGKEQRKYCSTECQYKAQKLFWNSDQERKQRSERSHGEKNGNWRGGRCTYQQLLRATRIYKEFVQIVYRRDKYICQECGQVGGKLCVHHIKSVAQHPWLVMDFDNVETLCHACHRKTDSFLVAPPKSKRYFLNVPVEIKNNRFQEFGTCSAEITLN